MFSLDGYLQNLLQFLLLLIIQSRITVACDACIVHSNTHCPAVWRTRDVLCASHDHTKVTAVQTAICFDLAGGVEELVALFAHFWRYHSIVDTILQCFVLLLPFSHVCAYV